MRDYQWARLSIVPLLLQLQLHRIPSVVGWLPDHTCSCTATRRSISNVDGSLPLIPLSLASNNLQDISTCPTEPKILATSEVLGDIYSIRLSEDDDFLAANSVPTFACTGPTSIPTSPAATPRYRGLEGVLPQGPAFVLDNILSSQECEDLIATFEDDLGFGNYQAGKNHHGALQIVVPSAINGRLAQALGRHIDLQQVQERRIECLKATPGTTAEEQDVRLYMAGWNRRWRVYRYAPGGQERFAPHIDAGFPPSGLQGDILVWDDSASYLPPDNPNTVTTAHEVVSRLTVLLYLNDDFVGGETNFYQPQSTSAGSSSSVIAAVKPVAGSCLVFPQGVGSEAVDYARQHWPLHEGSPVQPLNDKGDGRPKYVIRSDVIFVTTSESLILENPLFRHDHLVRQTFMPKITGKSPWNSAFLSQIESLYNPHMGVENLASLLYSLIRFTKKRKIVEIGAGYTTPWILQALHDNDKELQDIRGLHQQGQCRLLDIDWAVGEEVDNLLSNTGGDDTSSSLLCIDNCLHQKETATGACAVAKTLGLDKYLHFVQGDAFEMGDLLEEASVDLLWCDFGVGSRMADFLQQGAWAGLKPGGLLVCRSTLTNQRTRQWLEAVRAGGPPEVTGLPSKDCLVELSLLEPHKKYQNSISIFQKRQGGDESYSEPIYSEYA